MAIAMWVVMEVAMGMDMAIAMWAVMEVAMGMDMSMVSAQTMVMAVVMGTAVVLWARIADVGEGRRDECQSHLYHDFSPCGTVGLRCEVNPNR